jgi:hypothetical protein
MEVEMRKNPVTTKAPAEQVVKDIRRATRKLCLSFPAVFTRRPDCLASGVGDPTRLGEVRKAVDPVPQIQLQSPGR